MVGKLWTNGQLYELDLTNTIEHNQKIINRLMNITSEQESVPVNFKNGIKITTDYSQPNPKSEFQISYERYDILMQTHSENQRLIYQITEFKSSIFYKLYKWFN